MMSFMQPASLPLSPAEAPDVESGRSLNLLVRLTCIALFLTYVISWRLYVPGFRIFGLAPIMPILTQLPAATNWGLFALTIIALVWLFILPAQKILGIIVAVIWVVWVLQDINRLQPYNLMYCYTLLMAAFCRRDAKTGLNALRLMVSGVYFWAGFHKLNISFFDIVFPWFIAPLYKFGHPPDRVLDYVFSLITIITPLFELLIGIFVLFPRLCRLATLMALTMLITVLLCLGPLGHNWGVVVLPWNIWLFAMELQLFFYRGENTKTTFLFFKMHHTSRLSVIFFMLAPAICIYNPIYTQAGFKLYSGNIVQGTIIFAPEETLARAPLMIKRYVSANQTLDITAWVVDGELKNLPYPAPQPLRTSAAGLCPYLDAPSQAILCISYPAPFYSLQRHKENTPLCPTP